MVLASGLLGFRWKQGLESSGLEGSPKKTQDPLIKEYTLDSWGPGLMT